MDNQLFDKNLIFFRSSGTYSKIQLFVVLKNFVRCPGYNIYADRCYRQEDRHCIIQILTLNNSDKLNNRARYN